MPLIRSRVLFEFLILAVCGLRTSLGQSPSSPCPNVFSYQQDDRGWFGLITGRSSSYGDEVKTLIVMEYDGMLRNGAIKDIYRLSSDEEMRQAVARGGPIRYRLDLDVQPLPRVKKIEFNGRIVCESVPEERPYGDLTTARREHTLYPRGDPGPSSRPPTASFRPIIDVHTPTPEWATTRRPPTASFRPIINVHTPTPEWVTTRRPPTASFRPIIDVNMDIPEWVTSRRPPTASFRPIIDVNTPTPEWVTSRRPPTASFRPIIDNNPPTQSTGQASSNNCGQAAKLNPLIRMGNKTQPGEWPWLVGLFHGSGSGLEFQCGGTLLANRFIITAAHCLFNPKTDKELDLADVIIVAGATDLTFKTSNADFLVPSEMYLHEAYQMSTSFNDIALLVLRKPVTQSDFVKPICLWEGDDDQEILLDLSATVVGWGQTGDGPSLEVPLRIDVPIVTLTQCRGVDPKFHALTNDKTFCAGKMDKSGPCKGDSGSGLYIKQNNRWRLRGVVSFSLYDDCGPASYVVYTDVAKFKGWIHSKIINHL